MKKIVALLLIALLLSVSGCLRGGDETHTETPGSGEVKETNAPKEVNATEAALEIARGENIFAVGLYGRVAEGDGNVLISPYSIHTALTMAYEGAEGKTAREMETVLHLPAEREVRLVGFKELIENLNPKDETYKLRTANALWVQKDYPIRDSYIETIRSYYLSEVRKIDFQRNPEEAASTINDWVREKTGGKIKGIVSPEAVRDSKLVITNAIYFSAEWVHKFDPHLTDNETFFTPRGPVIAPMMHTEGVFNYTENDLVQVLELPYTGGRLSMVILLPKERNGYKRLEGEMTEEYLLSLLANLSPANVSVTIPKFEFMGEYELSSVLSAMGMKSAFGNGANFSGITPAKGLYISEVVHKAYIKVAENGTEAAAVTGVLMASTSLHFEEPTYVEFHADHPFIFIILDRKTGEILFLGRLTNPKG